MGKMPTNSLGKSSESKLHCFCLFDAYSMPKDMCSVFESKEIAKYRKFETEIYTCLLYIYLQIMIFN